MIKSDCVNVVHVCTVILHIMRFFACTSLSLRKSVPLESISANVVRNEGAFSVCTARIIEYVNAHNKRSMTLIRLD